eukprot:PhM_4_TR14227/c4_g3_i2/m.66644/K14803/PTC2_3; protein phosphatase PTC2/3
MLRRSIRNAYSPVRTMLIHQAPRPSKAKGPWARLDAACVEVNGCRDSMEDAHILSKYDPKAAVRVFGVFDGHREATCAELVAKEMETRLTAMGKAPSDDAITQACVAVDEITCARSRSGCVATFASIWPDEAKNNKLHVKVANIGDARIVRGCAADAAVMEALTEDHLPDVPVEEERIKRAGGYVASGRVCGRLMPSRAFGDPDYKTNKHLPPLEQMVCVQPDLRTTVLNDDDFLVIACDGVYESVIARPVTRADVVDIVRKVLSSDDGDVVDAAKAVVSAALDAQSYDNISCMVVWNNVRNKPKKKHPKFIAGPLSCTTRDFIDPYVDSFRRAGLTLREGIEARIKDIKANRLYWPVEANEEEHHLKAYKADKKAFLESLKNARW